MKTNPPQTKPKSTVQRTAGGGFSHRNGAPDPQNPHGRHQAVARRPGTWLTLPCVRCTRPEVGKERRWRLVSTHRENQADRHPPASQLKRKEGCAVVGALSARTLTLTSPAKINLMLAITGRRTDGFHELVSVVAPLDWGDTLAIEVSAGAEVPAGTRPRTGDFALECDDPGVPLDGSNLVLKAAQAFRVATGWNGSARFSLQKRIPMGAGLGGGSSNAAAALRGLNQLAGALLTRDELMTVAAGVGSDCALFLHEGPVVMRGRGERVEALPESVTARLKGVSVLVFKPAFGIATAWAYAQLAAAAPASYVPAAEAEARLARWIAAAGKEATGPATVFGAANSLAGPGRGGSSEPLAGGTAGSGGSAVDGLLFNNMEPPAFAKFPALPLLIEQLQREFGLAPRMSGSGSACFVLPPADAPLTNISAMIRRCWGQSTFVVHAHLA